ncbi:ATP-dependent RNA helicase RhlB [hydrothermal vent metagenome]|uniref:ATP-dependent RNA helicase RhlB n=1 Tax=hydrothermal vent metagenome TaxID=652676 RepID=A0A3B0ZNB1_9ZZZZ
MSQQHLTESKFTDFELEPVILDGLKQAGYLYCTPIQEKSLPYALKGLNITGQAQTGTGKTAAFLVACFQYLLTHPNSESSTSTKTRPRAIMIAPTRELAIQIHKEAVQLSGSLSFKMALAYGGTGYEQQKQTILAGTDILIGTPGRMIDYFKQGVFDLRAVQVMVMDEADRMFDLGFIKDIRYLLRRMPAPDKRLNLMFSATLSHRVNELAYEHMNNPQQVVVETENKTASGITESVYYPSKEEKIPLLLGILKDIQASRTLIFINTKRTAEAVQAWLKGNDWDSAVLSGDVHQKKRLRILEDFTAGKLPILIATDVAARGLHIPDVSHVINFDLPQDNEDYVHRIGRTARAGAVGDAISFACEEYVFSLPDIEEYIGHKIPVESIPASLLVEPKPSAKILRAKPPQHNKKGKPNANKKPYKGKPRTSKAKPV